jgi:hypothetical protein
MPKSASALFSRFPSTTLPNKQKSKPSSQIALTLFEIALFSMTMKRVEVFVI